MYDLLKFTKKRKTKPNKSGINRLKSRNAGNKFKTPDRADDSPSKGKKSSRSCLAQISREPERSQILPCPNFQRVRELKKQPDRAGLLARATTTFGRTTRLDHKFFFSHLFSSQIARHTLQFSILTCISPNNSKNINAPNNFKILPHWDLQQTRGKTDQIHTQSELFFIKESELMVGKDFVNISEGSPRFSIKLHKRHGSYKAIMHIYCCPN